MADVVNSVKNVGNTFTSWDKCMSQTYCKWPVIAAIIVGSLIVLSVLWCILSCLCCGITLCNACVKCVTCFGCCGACKSDRRKKDVEYRPMPPTPTPYQPQQPMVYNSTGPQFATFDAGSKRGANVHEDSLPAMPSWDTARTRRVEDHSSHPEGSNVEMERMLPPSSPVREAYHSDLGAQRLNYAHASNTDYYEHSSQPLSPAPTYRSTASPTIAGALMPTSPSRFYPQQQPQHHDDYDHYDHQNTSYNRGMTSSVAPYPSSRESTQFGPPSQRSMSPPQHYNSYQSPSLENTQYTVPSHRSMSPPQHYNSYQAPDLQPTRDTRPPSLLQVGRKPVAGSYREV